MAQILNLTSISTLVIIAILVVIEEKWHAFVHKIPKSPVDSKFVGHYTNSEEKSHIGLCLHFYHTHTHTHTHTITHVSKDCDLCIMWKQIVVVVQSLSHVQVFATPWTAACQASLSVTVSQSLLKFMSTELVMLSNHLILCRPLLLLPSIFPSIKVFSNESALGIR